MKYRKKNNVIEAIKYLENIDELRRFIAAHAEGAWALDDDKDGGLILLQDLGSYGRHQMGVLRPGDYLRIVSELDGRHPVVHGAEAFESVYEPSSIVTGTTGLAPVYVEALEGLGISLIDGQPSVCEQHPWRLWPHGDDDCAGPGMPLSAAEGSFGKIARFQ